jgi:hypothetical protein
MTGQSDDEVFARQEDVSVIAKVLGRSSFGTEGVRSLRGRVSRETAERVAGRGARAVPPVLRTPGRAPGL